MILLRTIDSCRPSMSTRSLLCCQEILPFSIRRLIENKTDEETTELYENLFDEALTTILKDQLKIAIASNINTEDKLKSLHKDSFSDLNRLNRIHHICKLIIFSKEERFELKILTFFKNEVVDKVHQALVKFTQTKTKEDFMIFIEYLIEKGLIKDTPAEEFLGQFLNSLDTIFDLLIQTYRDFKEKISSFNIFTGNLQDLKQYCLEETIMNQEWFIETPPLIKFFVNQLINNLRTDGLKHHSMVFKSSHIKQAIKSNIQFLFFGFEETSRELLLFIKTERSIIEWERKINKLEAKLKEAKELDVDSIMSSDRRSQILVSTDEFKEVFRSLEPSDFKFIKDLPKYKSLLEKETMALSSFEDEEMTFQDVLAEYIKECIPLSQTKLDIIEREALRFKVDHLLLSESMIKESDLEPMVQEFSKYINGKEDEVRLVKLKQLRDDVHSILNPDYPENIDSHKRLENVKSQSERLSKIFIDGPCKEKIKRLCKVINFISEIEDYLRSQGIYINGHNRDKSSSSLDENPLKDVDWSKMDFLKKSLFFKNKYLSLFPDIENFVHKIYSSYMIYLMEQASLHGEKTDVSTILLIETIYLNIRHKPELNPIYIRRRESLISLLRGCIQLHQSNNLTINNLKSQVEELLEKKRYLKGFSEDKTSKVNQALSFLSQLEAISVILRRIKVFRTEDVTTKNRDMYRIIADAMNSTNIKYLPLSDSELHCSEIEKFKQYFEKVNSLVNQWETLKLHISDIHCALPKYLIQNHFNQVMMQIFELPDIEIAEKLREGMSTYRFLDDTVQLIVQQIEITRHFESHLDDGSNNYKKVSEDIEQFKSSSTRKELQVFIQNMMKSKLPELCFITNYIKNSLRFYWVYNKLTSLLYEPIPLKELETTYSEVINSDKCNDYVKAIIKNKKMTDTIEGRIQNAQKLRNEFLNCSKMTAERFFQLLSQIRNSSVKLFSNNETPNFEALSNYLAIMETVETNYTSTKGNLSSLSFEDYQRCTRLFAVSSKVDDFVMKQLREPIDFEKLMEELTLKERPYRLEVESIIEYKYNPDSKAFQALDKFHIHQEAELNHAKTEVEELTLSNLFGAIDKREGIKKALDKIDVVKYQYDNNQLELLVRILIWMLKETDLFDQKSSSDLEDSLISLNLLDMMHSIYSNIKVILQAPKTTFAIEELIKRKSDNSQDTVSNSHRDNTSIKHFDDLLKLLTPVITSIDEIYSIIMDCSVKVKKEGLEDTQRAVEQLERYGLPKSVIKKLDLNSILNAKTEYSNGVLVENELLNSKRPLLAFTKVAYQKLEEKSLNILDSHKNAMKEKFEVLLASVEPLRSKKASISTPIKEHLIHPSDKKKTLATKVSDYKDTKKQAKNNSDQKENEIESRGKMLDVRSKKVADNGSRKQSHASVSGVARDEESGRLTPLHDNNHTMEDKQLKKRKPEVIKEEKKETKKPTMAIQKQGSGKTVLFETLTLRSKDKKLENKKVSFIPTVEGLEEDVIDTIGLRGHLDLEISHYVKGKSQDSFDNCKAQIRKGVKLIYGYLNCRSNDVGALLDDSEVWIGNEKRIGKIWLFSSKQDKDFVRDYHFLPSQSMTAAKSYYLFIFEKRTDAKDLDPPSHSRKTRASPEAKRNGYPIIDETKSQRESKSRSAKGAERATRSRKNHHK